MTPRSIPAHFDGKHIQLDQKVTLKPNAKLLVVVLPENEEAREEWTQVSLSGLTRAYGNNEPEYSLDMVKEPNPDYDPRG